MQWRVSVQVAAAVRQLQQVAVQFTVSEQFTAVWEEYPPATGRSSRGDRVSRESFSLLDFFTSVSFVLT